MTSTATFNLHQVAINVPIFHMGSKGPRRHQSLLIRFSIPTQDQGNHRGRTSLTVLAPTLSLRTSTTQRSKGEPADAEEGRGVVVELGVTTGVGLLEGGEVASGGGKRPRGSVMVKFFL
jgi:hypothetical protein